MKLTTIALATAFVLSSTFAVAQQNGATGAQGGATGVIAASTWCHLSGNSPTATGSVSILNN
jgi:hypothetical protein